MVRPYSPGDGAYLLGCGLRKSDVEEVEGLGKSPEQGLLESVEASGMDCMVVTADLEPVAVFGVSAYVEPGMHGVGAPWFLAADGIYDVAEAFLRQTAFWVEWMNRLYPHLFNLMSDDNLPSKKWLRRAGFHIFPPQPLGVNGKLYAPFTRVRSPK